MYFNIYYESHTGQVLNLVESPYHLQTADLFDYTWEPYTESGYITAFEKTVTMKKATLTITADSPEEYYEAINQFYEIAELDVLNMTPGKLYIGNQYLLCYIMTSEKVEWESGIEQLDAEISFVTDYPYWVTEQSKEFKMSEATSSNNKKYHNRYAHRYANGLTNTDIANEHFSDVNFLMRIHGPCVNPTIIIGGYPYSVSIVLEDREYLEINSRDGTVIKTMLAGQKVNAFHNRSKKDDVFRKIRPGLQSVNWSGKFDFDLTLYKERGEPRWL